MANISLDEYLKNLHKDFDHQTGKYFAYVISAALPEEHATTE
jgi:hypothetical protein